MPTRHTLIAALILTGLTRLSYASLIDDLASQVNIIGGKPVASTDAIAATTVAFTAGGALCTASLIYDDIAVTAAHCVDGTPVSQMALVFSRSLDASRVKARVVAAIVNSKWRSVGDDEPDQGDIALVRFAGGIPAGYRKAKILTSLSSLVEGATVTLAGYGITSGVTHAGAGTLRKVDVTIAQAAYGRTEIIFDQRDGHGACHGDSGGPAFVAVRGELQLFGVTNRGFEDDADTCRQYAVYTKIPAYRSWISSAVKALRKRS